MINIIVPVVENVEGFSNFVNMVKGKNVKLFVGVIESLAKDFVQKVSGVELHIFSNKSKKEEIINSLATCNILAGKILLVRRPLTKKEFEQLTTSSKDIATLKAKHNKFVSFFKNLANKIIRRFFAFNFFEDISAICYNESMFQLLRVCSNFSKASRINKYVGVEIEEFETENKPVKKDYNHHKNNLILSLWTLLLLASVAGGILVCIFTPLRVLTVILVICWIFVALVLWFVGLVNFTRTVAVGDLQYGRAEEIQKS